MTGPPAELRRTRSFDESQHGIAATMQLYVLTGDR